MSRMFSRNRMICGGIGTASSCEKLRSDKQSQCVWLDTVCLQRLIGRGSNVTGSFARGRAGAWQLGDRRFDFRQSERV